MKTIFLLTLFLFLTLMTLFRLFSSNPSHPPHPSFQPAFVRLNQPQNPVDKIVKTLYPEPEASLLSGILIGTKAQMPTDFYQNLQKTGTLHMIALSGQNISLLIALVAFLLKGLGKKLSSFITVIIIIIFIIFVGPSASVIRAGLMGGFVMLSVIFGRQYLAVLGLVISGLIMFVISPQVIFNIGWQLSFGATLGIILLSAHSSLSLSHTVIARRDPSLSLRAKRSNLNDSSGQAPQSSSKIEIATATFGGLAMTIKQSMLFDLKTTLAAQLFTTPIVLYNFHNLSIVAPLTNVLILWTIPILMYGGFAVVFISLIPLISPIFLTASWFLYPLLVWFVEVVNWTASLPFSSFTIGNFSLGMAYFYYGILFLALGIFRFKYLKNSKLQIQSSK